MRRGQLCAYLYSSHGSPPPYRCNAISGPKTASERHEPNHIHMGVDARRSLFRLRQLHRRRSLLDGIPQLPSRRSNVLKHSRIFFRI